MTLKEFLAKKAAAKDRKAKRIAKRRQMGRLLEHQSIKNVEKAAWDACSLYIRLRDKLRYGGKCFICRSAPIEAACHIIPRGRRATKYLSDNLRGGCHSCNYRDRFEPGYHDIFISLIIDEIGPERFKTLVAASRTTVKRAKATLLEIRAHYLSLIQTLSQ